MRSLPKLPTTFSILIDEDFLEHCLTTPTPPQIVADSLWLTTTEFEDESDSHTKLCDLAKEMLEAEVVSTNAISNSSTIHPSESLLSMIHYSQMRITIGFAKL